MINNGIFKKARVSVLRPHVFIIALIFLTIFFLRVCDCLSAIKEETEEKALKLERLERKPPSPQLSHSVALFFGYDTNPDLTTTRKGDTFEEFLYTLDFIKPWLYQTRFAFFYDLDVLEYNDANDVSTMLNHIRYEIDKQLFCFNLGTGYDIAIFNYLYNDDGDFFFHRPFVYLGQRLSSKIYHQLYFEYGIKDYLNQKALSDTINTYQDKERLDKRISVEYRAGCFLMPKLLFKLRAKYAANHSNARYLDFYDYNSYELAPGIDYRFANGLEPFSNISHTWKNYDMRRVTLKDYKQKDKLWTTNAGIRYKLDKNNIVSLFHTYRNNSSNDSLEKYSENVITFGWQYNF